MNPPTFTEYEKCTVDLQKIGYTLWIYAAVQFTLSNLISLPNLFFHVDLTWLVLLAATILSGCVALLAGLDSTHTRLTGLKVRPVRLFSTLILSLCVMYFVSMAFGLLFSVFGASTDVLPDTYGTGERILSFVTAGLAGPILEELFFRGFVFGCLKKYGTVFAAVVSSLAFSMLHLNFVQGIPVFFFGLIFCRAIVRTGSLWTSILLHIINNMVALVSSGWPEVLGIVLLVLAAAGLVLVLVRLPKLVHWIEEAGMEKPFYERILQAPAFWSFALFFLLLSTVQVFL